MADVTTRYPISAQEMLMRARLAVVKEQERAELERSQEQRRIAESRSPYVPDIVEDVIPATLGGTKPTPETWGDAGGSAVVNFWPSAIRTLRETLGAVAPWKVDETRDALMQLFSGTVHKAVPGDHPSERAPEAVAQFYADRYGGEDELKRTLAYDPAGLVMDASVVAGAPGLARAGATVASRGSSIVGREVGDLVKSALIAAPENVRAGVARKVQQVSDDVTRAADIGGLPLRRKSSSPEPAPPPEREAFRPRRTAESILERIRHREELRNALDDMDDPGFMGRLRRRHPPATPFDDPVNRITDTAPAAPVPPQRRTPPTAELGQSVRTSRSNVGDRLLAAWDRLEEPDSALTHARNLEDLASIKRALEGATTRNPLRYVNPVYSLTKAAQLGERIGFGRGLPAVFAGSSGTPVKTQWRAADISYNPSLFDKKDLKVLGARRAAAEKEAMDKLIDSPERQRLQDAVQKLKARHRSTTTPNTRLGRETREAQAALDQFDTNTQTRLFGKQYEPKSLFPDTKTGKKLEERYVSARLGSEHVPYYKDRTLSKILVQHMKGKADEKPADFMSKESWKLIPKSVRDDVRRTVRTYNPNRRRVEDSLTRIDEAIANNPGESTQLKAMRAALVGRTLSGTTPSQLGLMLGGGGGFGLGAAFSSATSLPAFAGLALGSATTVPSYAGRLNRAINVSRRWIDAAEDAVALSAPYTHTLGTVREEVEDYNEDRAKARLREIMDAALYRNLLMERGGGMDIAPFPVKSDKSDEQLFAAMQAAR